MNKKSIVLTLFLIGGLITPQETKPVGPISILLGAIGIGCIHCINENLNFYSEARNCISSENDINEFDILITIHRGKNKKRSMINIEQNIKTKNYRESLHKVKLFLDSVEYEPRLKITISTIIKLKNKDSIELSEINTFLYQNQYSKDIETSFILRNLKSILMIPKNNSIKKPSLIKSVGTSVGTVFLTIFTLLYFALTHSH